MATVKQSLIDKETLDYLDNQRLDDSKIVRNIELEHENIEFIFEHAERYNNWKTDELYMERSFLAEAAFLEKIHDEEQENLKKRQIEEAASQKSIEEDQRTFNFIINEMKSLKVQCDQNMRTEALKAKEAKIHHAKVLAQLVRNQKEIEQMREVHLLQQKYISRYLDCELEIIDENEALLSEHTAKEQALEDHLKQQADTEENVISMKLMSLQSSQNERNVSQLAASVRERQRKEAKVLAHKEQREAKRREKEFWTKEIGYLKAHMARLGLPTEGPVYDAKEAELLNRIPSDLFEPLDETDLEHTEDESTAPVVVDDINVEAARALEAPER
ncbi:hypothetical protein BCR33DRAFT_171606 [Rhizoclosmatium globosum]|uniref:Uncharacterized protein n=1 Tax=Rhizoclosmatium globosum TaxID=329046 RepID=A0A1Y2CFP2_9FUNG|nr:hypothetical protein BCR33DRAFT_171606 [Rhizoclosmatium globosum]|eukprot:ORY45624.1 hypothetical protein BCR33DRAFT_171606 [Rhizoclosmatium globosum]